MARLPRAACLLVVLCWAAASVARAQTPAGPPPPSSRVEGGGPGSHELLPDIGRIGAQVGVLAGGSWNPYRIGRGIEVGGFIDLPLARAPGGKLSYEIFLALSLARSSAFTLTHSELGPRLVRTRLRLLQASPFALKYTLTSWGRVRPYLDAGADVLVASTREESGADPFPPQAPELQERGNPTGEVGIELGGHAGVGFEARVSGGLSLNFDYRFTLFEGRHARLHAASGALGIHW